MTENKRYKVIVSDRAKRMLGTHIRFMAQVNKEATAAKKKEIMTAMRSLCQMPQRFPFFEEPYITPNKYHKISGKKERDYDCYAFPLPDAAAFPIF
ncbi:putative uncharacterized protein [Firmicutes bacterium CAG:646]|nr:putative uncharacterized protein [Firmicutes bacterium CAG:646]